MNPPTKLTFVVVALLAGNAALASVTQLIAVHVPVFTGDGIKIRELEFLTWRAMPESGIDAVVWPYKVNSPHTESDGKNINPASMVNLRISPVLFPASSCVITIDVRDMSDVPSEISRAHGPVTKRDVLMAVIRATADNLRANDISGCGLVVEGIDDRRELRGVTVPKTFE